MIRGSVAIVFVQSGISLYVLLLFIYISYVSQFFGSFRRNVCKSPSCTDLQTICVIGIGTSQRQGGVLDYWQHNKPAKYYYITTINTSRGDDKPSLLKHNTTKTIKEARSAIDLAKEPLTPLEQTHQSPQRITAIAQRTAYAAAQTKKQEKLQREKSSYWFLRNNLRYRQPR